LKIFLQSIEKIQVLFKSVRKKGILFEEPYTFLILSRSFLLSMRNVSENLCRENQNTHFVFSNLVFENLPLMGILFIIIGVQPLGRSGQRPEFSQATGMALVRCIVGRFLGVACHCFPPAF